MIWAPRQAYDINKIKDDEVGGECLKHGETRHACKVLVVKPEVQRPLSRLGCKWDSNSKINFTEIQRRRGGVGQELDSSGMEKVQVTVFLQNTVMNPWDQ